MTEEIIIAGLGGQGVLSMGKILAYSGIMEGKEVSWMPSYGPEMRGGTANVSLVISNERISSPIINKFDTAIVLNQPSLDKFENAVKPGGYLLYDPNGINNPPTRKDINIYSIEAAAKASELGLSKVFNMIVMGGFLKIKPIVGSEFIRKGLEASLPVRHHSMIPENEKAVEIGKELVKEIQKI
jgi:2-oxoglutarate ferredoxin oxidoreductase subunit gamma